MLLLEDLVGRHVDAVRPRQDHRADGLLAEPAEPQPKHHPGFLASEVPDRPLAGLVPLLHVLEVDPCIQPSILGLVDLLLLRDQSDGGKHGQPRQQEGPADVDLDERYAVTHKLNIGRSPP